MASYTTVIPGRTIRLVATLMLAAAVASGQTPATPRSRAEVNYTAGKLEVTASNSSLNLILREIGHKTGMKITGGVAEERVFGHYGPADPADVLTKLLDGTGSNMLLRETAAKVPSELILTTRTGGPTPPNPNAASFDEAPAAPPPTQQVQGPPSPPVPPNPQTPPASGFVSAPTSRFSTEPGTTPGPTTQATGTSDPQPSDSQPTSPNGVKTPQQIYEQLQQLRQQQQANQH